MKYREVLNEVQPRYVAAIAAIVAAAASGASMYANSKAQAKAKRTAANAAQLANQGGGGTPTTPTAARFMEKSQEAEGMSEERLSSLMQPEQQPMPATAPTEPSTTAPPAVNETPMERMQREEQERRARMGM